MATNVYGAGSAYAVTLDTEQTIRGSKTFHNSDPAKTPVIIKRYASNQDADMISFRREDNTELTYIDSYGDMTFGSGTAAGMLNLNARGAGSRPLIVRAATGQTADITQWQNGAGANLSSINYRGSAIIGPTRINAADDVSGRSVVAEMVIPDPASAGFTIQAAAGQTGNLMEFYDSSGWIVSSVGSTGSLNSYAGATVYPKLASSVGIIVRGNASQTANLTEFQNSAGTTVGAILPDGSTTLKKTIRIPSTWHVPGEVKVPVGDENVILPRFVTRPAGTTEHAAYLMYQCDHSNSAWTATFVLEHAPYVSNTYTAIGTFTATQGQSVADITDTLLPDGGKVRIRVTSISGTPKNMYVTLFNDYVF